MNNIIRRALAGIAVLLAATGLAAAQPAGDGGAAAAEAQQPAAETPVSEGEAPTAEQLWERGNTAYGDGRYDEAKGYYKAILDSGLHSFKLYYNLANACFKTGALGESILFYNRALKLAPAGSDDARYNLEIAEAQTKDKITVVPEFFLWRAVRTLRNCLGCTGWSLLSLAAFALAAAGALMFLLGSRTGVRKGGFYITLAAVLCFVVATWCAAAQRRELLDRSEAIVMATAISVKSSPDKSATDIFVLHEGTRVRIVSQVAEWCEIVIADGKKGWLPAAGIERI